MNLIAVTDRKLANSYRLVTAEIGEPGALSPSELSLHLQPHWIEVFAPEDLPDSAVVLAREPKAGRKIRLEIDWMGQGDRMEKWYLLDPVKGASPPR